MTIKKLRTKIKKRIQLLKIAIYDAKAQELPCSALGGKLNAYQNILRDTYIDEERKR